MSLDVIVSIVFFVVLAGICIGIGVMALLKSGESKNLLLAEIEEGKKNGKENLASGESGFAATLDKNNQLLSSYNKTEKIQNELKIMQASSSPEKA